MIEIPGAPQSIDEESKDEFVPIQSSFGAHHLLWLDCLQKVEDGHIKRLMGLMPPGSGKSVYTSVVFPTHYLGRFPGRSVIVTSYGSDLPKKFGRRARSIVTSPLYKRIFDAGLSDESGAVDEWALTTGSEWLAKGILTGITGNRVDGIIWDDLIKGREQADSPIVRQKTWDAYVDDLQTRRKPFTWEVGINTRWHEDDPAGRILPKEYNGESGWIKCQDGNDWFVVCLAAICERNDDLLGRKPGDRLWPEWFTDEHFAQFRRQARTWNALFQQRPAPETGDFFQADWLKHYDKPPARDTLNIYGASDYAVTQNGGDYTVHIVVGVDPQHRIYVLDLWRAQASSDKWVTALCDLVEKWKPLGWAEEKGQITAGVGPLLNQKLRERQLYVVRAQFPTKGDKRVRAQSIRGRMAMDGLYVPTHATWFPEFKRELMVFDAGTNDDQCLIAGTMIKMADGQEQAIESVRVGDLVWTPQGPRQVLASQSTNKAANVWRVSFSNGASLVGTGRHPVYIYKKGFVPIDTLRIMDRVVTVEHDLCVKIGLRRQLLPLFTEGIGTVNMLRGLILRLRRRAAAICTVMCGKITLAQFQRATTFTMLMEIQQTMRLSILSALQSLSIGTNTRWLGLVWNAKGSTCLESGCWPVNGTDQKLGLNGTDRMDVRLGKTEKLHQKDALVVPSHLNPRLGRQKEDFAQVDVVSVTGLEALTVPMEVHNLTVQDASVYYANGILTHNCDALGLIGQVLDRMIKGKPAAEAAAPAKVLSTDPSLCTVTLDDLFEMNERRSKYSTHRIH